MYVSRWTLTLRITSLMMLMKMQMRLSVDVDVSLEVVVVEVDPGFSFSSSTRVSAVVPSFQGNSWKQVLRFGLQIQTPHSSNNYSEHHSCHGIQKLLW